VVNKLSIVKEKLSADRRIQDAKLLHVCCSPGELTLVVVSSPPPTPDEKFFRLKVWHGLPFSQLVDARTTCEAALQAVVGRSQSSHTRQVCLLARLRNAAQSMTNAQRNAKDRPRHSLCRNSKKTLLMLNAFNQT